MAYFERADERDKLIVCNICNVKCSERGITTHKAKCAVAHKVKFDKGDLERCTYDSSHMVKGGMMSIHLEFCSKRQNQLVAEYQLVTKAKLDSTSPEELPAKVQCETRTDLPLDDWGRDANSESFIAKVGNLKI